MFQWLEKLATPLALKMKMTETAARVNRFAAQGCPVFLDAQGEPCFSLEQGPTRHRIFLSTIPKSGTYLFSELLTALGVIPVKLQIAETFFADHRFAPMESRRARPEELRRSLPADQVLPWIKPGQFAPGHFPFHAQSVQMLRDFKVLFTYRNLRDALVSQMRFMAKTGRGTSKEGWGQWPEGPEKMEHFLPRHGSDYFGVVKSMRDWVTLPNVMPVSYEEIIGDFGPQAQCATIQRICSFLELERTVQPETVLKATLGQDTLTFSGERTNRAVYWTDKVEAFFKEQGGDEIEKFWKEKDCAPTSSRRAA